MYKTRERIHRNNADLQLARDSDFKKASFGLLSELGPALVRFFLNLRVACRLYFILPPSSPRARKRMNYRLSKAYIAS